MSKAKPYSPRLEPDLIPVLYRERCRRKIPMTVLASRLIRAALRYEGVLDGRQASTCWQIGGRLPRREATEALTEARSAKTHVPQRMSLFR